MLTAENKSIVNGDITLDSAADVSLSGSTVNGDIAFAESADGAVLKLIESSVAGNVTLSGESNSLRVENSSIEGTLAATAGTITFAGTENKFGNLQLTGDVNVDGDITVSGALNTEGGFNLAGSSNLSTTEGLFVNDGTATLAGTVKQGDVTLTGTGADSTLSGTIETNLTLDNAQLFSSGTDADGRHAPRGLRRRFDLHAGCGNGGRGHADERRLRDARGNGRFARRNERFGERLRRG